MPAEGVRVDLGTPRSGCWLSLVEPLVAAALAVLLLGERLSAPVTAGAVLLLGGLVVVSRPRVRRAAPRRRRNGDGASSMLSQSG